MATTGTVKRREPYELEVRLGLPSRRASRDVVACVVAAMRSAESRASARARRLSFPLIMNARSHHAGHRGSTSKTESAVTCQAAVPRSDEAVMRKPLFVSISPHTSVIVRSEFLLTIMRQSSEMQPRENRGCRVVINAGGSGVLRSSGRGMAKVSDKSRRVKHLFCRGVGVGIARFDADVIKWFGAGTEEALRSW